MSIGSKGFSNRHLRSNVSVTLKLHLKIQSADRGAEHRKWSNLSQARNSGLREPYRKGRFKFSLAVQPRGSKSTNVHNCRSPSFASVHTDKRTGLPIPPRQHMFYDFHSTDQTHCPEPVLILVVTMRYDTKSSPVAQFFHFAFPLAASAKQSKQLC